MNHVKKGPPHSISISDRPRFEAECAFFVVSEGPARFGTWFMLPQGVSWSVTFTSDGGAFTRTLTLSEVELIGVRPTVLPICFSEFAAVRIVLPI
jgi:hypothetical protein